MNKGGKEKRDETQTWQEPIVLNALDLRNQADAYASLRGPKDDRYYFVQVGTPGEGSLEMRHDRPEHGEGIVFQLETSAQQPDRPKVDSVCIKAADRAMELADKYDTVFWSEAAVEKFVFPYLASKSLWRAAIHLQRLSACWYDGCPIPTADGTGEEVAIPFAIGHTPDSDFNFLEGSGLDLLFLRGNTVYALPLATLIAKREGEGHGTADPAPRTPASPDGA
jgi:hypothetical protein